MIEWVLIVWFHVGPISENDSMATATVTFQDQKECMAAGRQAVGMTDGSVKTAKFVCVKRTVK